MPRKRSTGHESTLLFDVWLLTHLTTRLLDDALRPLEITGDEFGLYSLIYSCGPATSTQISRWTGMSPTTVSGMVRRLAARGHLTHSPHPEDARSRLLGLSDQGRRVTVEAAKTFAQVLPHLQAHLRLAPGAVRAGLRDLDSGLRKLVDAAPHPYGSPTQRPDDQPAITYTGAPLTESQAAEARTFIDWIRARDERERGR